MLIVSDFRKHEMAERVDLFVHPKPAQAKMPEPLGLWNLLKKLSSRDDRRALTAVTGVLESLGKSLDASERDKPATKPFAKDSSAHSKQ